MMSLLKLRTHRPRHAMTRHRGLPKSAVGAVALAAAAAGLIVAGPASASSVSNVSFVGTSMTAGVTANWAVGFKTSNGAGGALTSGNTITAQFNSAFAIPASPTVTLDSGFSSCSVGAVAKPNATAVTITLAGAGCTHGSGSGASVTVYGITNPAPGSYVGSSFSVATSSDSATSPATVTITAGTAASGEGTMTVTPTPATTTAGSTGNQFTFTFTAPVNSTFAASSYATLTVPAGWTQPSTTSGAAGFTSAAGSCGQSIASVTGTGPWIIQVTQACAAGASFTITYGAGTNATHVTAPQTAGSAAFVTASHSAGDGGPAIALTASPTVTVSPGAANKLAFVQGPSDVETGAVMTPAVTVQVQDQFGNSVSNSGLSVTLAPSAGPILGANTTTNAAGLAAFGTIKINTMATGLTLTASASGLTGTPASASFNVTWHVSDGATLTDASVSDGAGSGVKNVAYYYCPGYTGACTNGTLIGRSTTPADNYAVTWNGQPASGAYRVVAVGTDNVNNASSASAAFPVTVAN